jgi:hypothetical protein
MKLGTQLHNSMPAPSVATGHYALFSKKKCKVKGKAVPVRAMKTNERDKAQVHAFLMGSEPHV